MSDDKVVSFSHPEKILVTDRLPEVLRSGASRLLVHAVEAEVQAFLAAHEHLVDDEGRQRVVRHGHMPEREVQTGIGPVTVRRPRVRDRQPDGEDGRIRFTSAIPPPYLRRTRSVEELLPWLYLKGISTGDFAEALAALLGRDAPGLLASTITRLKTAWREEYEHWSRRDLSAKRYVYFWADGVDFRPRMDHEKQCLLVIIGADEAGHKDIVAVGDGFRESEQSWHELLLDLKRRGESLPGFDHPLYPAGDPRATALLGALAAARPGEPNLRWRNRSSPRRGSRWARRPISISPSPPSPVPWACRARPASRSSPSAAAPAGSRTSRNSTRPANRSVPAPATSAPNPRWRIPWRRTGARVSELLRAIRIKLEPCKYRARRSGSGKRARMSTIGYRATILAFLLAVAGVAAQAGDVTVAAERGNTIARTSVDGCRVALELSPKWRSLRYRNSCRQPLARKVALFAELLDALARHGAALDDLASLFLGRLIRHPELALEAALAARGEGSWRNLGPGALNTAFADLLERRAILQPFEAPLRRHGLAGGGVSVEKGLLGRPAETPLASPLRAKGVGAEERLAYDAQVWLVLRSDKE